MILFCGFPLWGKSDQAKTGREKACVYHNIALLLATLADTLKHVATL